jgi:hypothetical protein
MNESVLFEIEDVTVAEDGSLVVVVSLGDDEE